MPIASPRYAFVGTTVAGAPDDPGVYALYQDEELVYYGTAVGPATILSQLQAHYSRLAAPAEASHYAWEITRKPMRRVAELLAEYRVKFQRLPKYNR